MSDSAPGRPVADHPYREFERAGWERAAGAYAGSFEAATALFAPMLLEAARIEPGKRVLDVACGPGPVTARAAALGATALGVDFSPAMIAEARRRHPALQFREADAEALPFEDLRFDAVVSNFGVHHFPFPQRALAEACRVLRPGGRIAFTTWAAPEVHIINRIVVDAVRAAGDPLASLPQPPGGAINQQATCLHLLNEAGFEAGSLRADSPTAHLCVDSVARLIEMLEAGTVRMASALLSQPAAKRAAILAAVEESLLAYRSDGGFRIPFVAIVASGRK